MNLPGSAEAAAFLLACTIKTTLLLGLSWITVSALRHRSAAMRHQVWALGILGSLTLPFLTLLLPAWHSSALGDAARFWYSAQPIAENPSSQRLPSMIIDASADAHLAVQLASLIFLIWTLGVLILILRLLAGLARVAWISAHSKPLYEDNWMSCVRELSKSFRIGRSVQVLQCEDPLAVPLTWGIEPARILLPSSAREWSAERERIVLSHELAHIARYDWLVQICAEMFRAFYWFHPLAWTAAARLRHESEQACDDYVLNSGVDASDYANQLLGLARTLRNSYSGWSALAIARTSNLERRFAAMLNPSINRSRVSRGALSVTGIAALCLLLPLAALRLPGQTLSGKFAGTIQDPSGAVVPNATVVMTNHKAKTIDMTTSDAEGNFVFKVLPTGDYEMKILKPGFRAYIVPSVLHDTNRSSHQAITLALGQISESVEVQAQGVTPVAPKPSRIRIGGSVQASHLLTKVTPVYPLAAKAAGVEGTVILHAVVGIDGKPLALQVMNADEIDPELARASVEAVSQWRYSPTLLNGNPVEVDTTVTVNFKLQP